MAPKKETRKSSLQPNKARKSTSPRIVKRALPTSSRPRARTTTAFSSSSISETYGRQRDGVTKPTASLRLRAETPQRNSMERLRPDSLAQDADRRTLTGPEWFLSLPPLGESSTPEQTRDFLDAVADYFQQWLSHDRLVGPASFFDDMNVIIDRMEDFASLQSHIRSSPVVSRALAACESSYVRFTSLWAKAARRAMCDKLAALNASVSNSLHEVKESSFTAFLADIRAISTTPAFRPRAETVQDIPVLVSQDDVRDATLLCEVLHCRFQDATYKTEMKVLWLLIWKSLKTSFIIYQRGGSMKLPPNSFVDQSFFQNERVEGRLRYLTQAPDAAHPRQIEEVVGHYCRYIADCCEKLDSEFAHLRGLRNEPLKAHVLASLRKFIETGKIETSTLPKLHFAVLRLNAISGGAKVLRRWNGSVAGQRRASETTDIHLVEGSSKATRRNSQRTRQATTQLGTGSAQTFPHPEGMNRKSAFDYVWYPFPETRAHEVAQNEQISREMAEPGIHSSGPRAAFLVNRPPRHARNPADVSKFSSRRRLGPLGWIGALLQNHLAARRRQRAVREQALDIPASKHQRATSSESHSAVIDPNARIHKRTEPTLKLRGGGGMSLQPSRKPPGPKHVSRDPVRLDPLEFMAAHVVQLQNALLARGEDAQVVEGLALKDVLPFLEQACYNIPVAAELYQERAQGPSQYIWVPKDAKKTSGQQQQPLGEPPIRAEDHEDTQANEHDENSRGPREDSNQENHTPTPARASSNEYVEGPCHPCPQYPGQYHHNCRCRVAVTDSGNAEDNSNEENIQPNEEEEEEEELEGEEEEEDPNGPPSNQQMQERLHPDDEKLIRNLFPFGHQLYWRVTEASDIVEELKNRIDIDDLRALDQDEKARAEILDLLLALRKQTRLLRDAYLGGLDNRSVVLMAMMPATERVRYNPDLPASRELCRRSFLELRRHYYRVVAMTEADRRYTNLGFRHALNRYTRSIREVSRLFFEYDHGLHTVVRRDDRDTTDTEETFSDEELQRMAEWKPRTRVLPTRQEYELMFKDELERELRVERKFDDFPKRYTKDWLITKLMELDQQGKYGCGAKNGYRTLENDLAARARPKKYNLETAIKMHKHMRLGRKRLERQKLKAQRRQKRRDLGLPPSIDIGDTPDQFTDPIDVSSGDDEQRSEGSSTTSAETP